MAESAGWSRHASSRAAGVEPASAIISDASAPGARETLGATYTFNDNMKDDGFCSSGIS